MKFKNLLPAVALLAPAIAMSMPATPEVIVQTNPDGTQVKLRGHGDYKFNFVTDEDGLFIMERDNDGYWARASRNGAFLMNVEADIDRLLEERFGAATPTPNMKTFAYDENGQSTFPTVGDNVHSLVVLLEYPDMPFTIDDPVGFYTRYLNEENFSYEDLSGSARDYFIAQSNGRFKPTFEVVKYRLPENHTAYTDDNWKRTLSTVLLALDSEIDFSRYDFDKDGLIDTVYFIYSGYGQADTLREEFIWPHQSSLYGQKLMLDGVYASNYACSNSLRGGNHYNLKDNVLTGIGTFCHEFSHVLGLPDLYHTKDAKSEQTPGNWTIMADGPYNNDGRTPPSYSAYERWSLKWIELPEVKDGESYTLKPIVDEPAGYKVPIPRRSGGSYKNEYYVIENRTKKGYDEYLNGSGMLIWHVDYLESAWINNVVNNTKTRPRCMVFTPEDGDRNYAAWPYKKSVNASPINYIAPGYASQLLSANKDGDLSKTFITNIKYDSDTQEVSFDYNVVTEANKLKPARLTLDREKNDNGVLTNNFVLTWDAVEGAKDYLVSISVQSSRLITVSGYDKKSTEGSREVKFTLSDGMIALPVLIDVYSVDENFPSIEPAKIRVTPKEAEWPFIVDDNVGVENIGADEMYVEISGGTGEVTAPLGAEIYNMNGIRTGNRNLPAGIYIVRYGNRVEKVFVK